jgi:hypothetical protein
VHLKGTSAAVSKGRKEKTKGCRHEAYEAPKKTIILAPRKIIIERMLKWFGVEGGAVLPYVI